MSDRPLYATDLATKIYTTYHGTPEGGVIIETQQDVEDIVEANKLLYNSVDERAGWKGDGFHRVASVPLTTLFDPELQHIFAPEGGDCRPFLKWLDDRDNLAWRTRPGRLA